MHFLNSLSSSGSRAAGPFSSCHWEKGRVNSGQVGSHRANSMIATDGFCDHSYEDTYTQTDFSIQCTLYGYVLVLAWIGFRQTLMHLTTGLFRSNPLTLSSRETQVLLTTVAKVLLGFKYD